MSTCFICEKHQGANEASAYHIYSSTIVSVYHMPPTDGSVYLGHTIKTNRHVPGLDGMTMEEAMEVGKFQKLISMVLKDQFNAEHVYAFVFGDGVPHLHIHLLPRYEGAPIQYRGVKVDEWQEAPHGNKEETIAFCMDFAKRLEELFNGTQG